MKLAIKQILNHPMEPYAFRFYALISILDISGAN